MEVRIDRALSQPLYLVEDSFPHLYIMGSTGNVYCVDIDSKLSCNCPDYLRRRAPCKHILFLLLRYYGLSVTQVCSNTDDLLTHIQNKKGNDNVYCSEYLQKKWNGKEEQQQEEQQGSPDPDDCCPICLEEFEMTEASSIVQCVYSCKNYVHTKCFEMYRKHNTKAKCPHCRADMPVSKKDCVWSDYKNLYD